MRRFRLATCVVAAVIAPTLLAACTVPSNPAFPLTTAQAANALREMRRTPRAAVRPIVVVGGFGDPGIGSSNIKSVLEPCLLDAQFLRVDPWMASSFPQARKDLVDAVQAAFPSADPRFTTEVDVVCNSMGGLVALYAIDPSQCSADAGMRTLRAAQVFTIASPLRGAAAAELPTLSPLVTDMRPGSQFLVTLGDSIRHARCEVIPYTISDDAFVGAVNTAPPGVDPWWVPAEFLHSGHMTAHNDKRILADIARRLRQETPYTREPREALPEK
jgi:hypothetical protein